MKSETETPLQDSTLNFQNCHNALSIMQDSDKMINGQS